MRTKVAGTSSRSSRRWPTLLDILQIMSHNGHMPAQVLTPEMADAALKVHEMAHKKTAAELLTEQRRVDNLRQTYEGTASQYQQHRDGINAARKLIELYGENPEVRKIEERAAAEIARLNEAVIDRELEYRQAEQQMFGPAVEAAVADDDALAYIHNLNNHNAIQLLKPAAVHMVNRFGHTPTAEERATVRQEIMQRRAAEQAELARLQEKKAYIESLMIQAGKRMGAVPEAVARPDVRDEVELQIKNGAELTDILAETNAEIFPLENREVHKRKFLENRDKIPQLQQKKKQIIEAKQQAQSAADQQQISTARTALT
jgi:hypothetical protein